MSLRRSAFLAALAASLGGCVFSSIVTPREYRSATPNEVRSSASDKEVKGRSCARSIAFLVAWGDEGYAASVSDALKDDPGAILYDVRSDILVQSYVFGLYTRVCTTVTGRVGKI
jgi:hypothetical protein